MLVGISQAELAHLVGNKQPYVGQVERGTQNLSAGMFRLLCAALTAESRKASRLPGQMPPDRPAARELVASLASLLDIAIPMDTGAVMSSWSPAGRKAEVHDKVHDGGCDYVIRSERRVMEACLTCSKTTPELLKELGSRTRTGGFRQSLHRLMEMQLLELTIPDRPRSKHQKYRLTDKGRAFLSQ